VTLHTHLVVREDAHLLYGFAEKRERELFRELIRLNGVGPKLALALMSGLEVDELVRCVQAQDTSALVRVPGVGKKTAERLLVELKDRFKAWETSPAMFALVSEPLPVASVQAPRPMRSVRWSRWATSRRKPARQLPSRTRPEQ
jgi:Holliday junction DNA helicase RuvA